MNDSSNSMRATHYIRLGLMAVISFISMYILMYAMVNSFSNIFNSVNQFYMAGLMTAPMIILELVLMRMMYTNKLWNGIIMATSIIFGIVFFLFIRQQTTIGDTQFLRSMIPHHAGAILMCDKASLEDPEIKELCGGIMKGQQSEIDQMKATLDRLESKN